MKLRIQLFAGARDRAGTDVAVVELDDPATIADLRAALVETCPGLASISDHLLFAVNDQYAANTDVVSGDPSVACFPPVSGG